MALSGHYYVMSLDVLPKHNKPDRLVPCPTLPSAECSSRELRIYLRVGVKCREDLTGILEIFMVNYWNNVSDAILGLLETSYTSLRLGREIH